MNSEMLRRFMQAKEQEIRLLQELDLQGKFPPPDACARPDLRLALNSPGPVLIAEYKRASPSMGVINSRIQAPEAADLFFRNKAGALSVLTEEKYFQGSLDYIEIFADTGLPVLRKDFLFHPLQIRRTAATKASALLLIARVVQAPGLLKELTGLSLELGIEPVVEIFTHDELIRARQSGARVILVNNRDLDRLKVSLDVSRELIKEKDSRETWICASGLEDKYHVYEFFHQGFDAFLIGTAVMSAADPGKKLREFAS